jgi:hypothetical protein
MDDNNDKRFGDLIRERFAALPQVVQNAITSADVQKHLRSLAEKHKLHLDQWETLENEVHMTLLGIKPSDQLVDNIQSEVGVDNTVARSLAADISNEVFEPIRAELERQLDHPEAKAEATSGVEDMGAQVLATHEDAPAAPAAPVVQATPVVPATPPAAQNTVKVERASLSATYAPKVASHERRTIEGDPYREQLI